MKFATCDVCSVSTGFLFGKMDGVYKVMSYLIGRPAFTHDLLAYAKPARELLEKSVPGIPTRDEAAGTDKSNYVERLKAFEARLGSHVELPETMAGALDDGRDVMDTMADVLSRK